MGMSMFDLAAEWLLEEQYIVWLRINPSDDGKDESLLVWVTFRGVHWPCILRSLEDGVFLLVEVHLPVILDEQRLHAVNAYALRLLRVVTVGAFVPDTTEGTLRFQSTLDLTHTPLTRDRFFTFLKRALLTSAIFLPDFQAVLSGARRGSGGAGGAGGGRQCPAHQRIRRIWRSRPWPRPRRGRPPRPFGPPPADGDDDGDSNQFP